MIGFLAALVAGALTVFGFAPFGLQALPVLGLAVLFRLAVDAPRPADAARWGFAFGLGLFGAGVSWVSIALHRFGAMPLPIAALATFGFCAYLALFPALAAWVTRALVARVGAASAAWIAAPAWTFAEWLRSWLLSGFPWLSIGYSQVPGSPLAGFAPLGGTFGVTLAVAILGSALAWAYPLLDARGEPFRLGRRWLAAAAVAIAVVAAGAGLRVVPWTAPAGEPVTVSLVQGNVPQDVKFDPGLRDRTLSLYRELIERSRGRLVVLPESALPMFAHEIPDEFARFVVEQAQARDGDVLFGVFVYSRNDGGQYHNSLIGVGSSGAQVYGKRHLVPFGETIPLKPITGWFIDRVLRIPLADQTPGPADQPPMSAAGQKLAVGICYEDAFGSEVIRQLPEATLLVNVSNDAWYGRSIAAEQHHQIASARAIETGRWMLRATQTGITALVDETGRESGRLPWFTVGILEGAAQPRTGATPYVRSGDWPVVAVCGAWVLVAVGVARSVRGRRSGHERSQS